MLLAELKASASKQAGNFFKKKKKSRLFSSYACRVIQEYESSFVQVTGTLRFLRGQTHVRRAMRFRTRLFPSPKPLVYSPHRSRTGFHRGKTRSETRHSPHMWLVLEVTSIKHFAATTDRMFTLWLRSYHSYALFFFSHDFKCRAL